MYFSFQIGQSQINLLNCMGCEKQNVNSQIWIKFLEFLQVFMSFGNKFAQKETHQNIVQIF